MLQSHTLLFVQALGVAKLKLTVFGADPKVAAKGDVAIFVTATRRILGVGVHSLATN